MEEKDSAPVTVPIKQYDELLQASYRAMAKLICADEVLRAHGITNLGNQTGDELVVNITMLLDKQKSYLQDIKNLEEELEQCREALVNTRIISTNAMNEIRAAAGAPQSQDDKSQKRAVDYVRELTVERDRYREALESISAETDMRNCRGIADRALKIP